MSKLGDSLSKKLTAMNMLVSGLALLLASAAFFTYDVMTFRTNLINGTSVRAQIVGANSVSPLIFNDPKSAENTLAALHSAPNVTYTGIYTVDGKFFAGYWRAQEPRIPLSLPPYRVEERQRSQFIEGRRFALLQTIFFENKPVGIVYVQSTLDTIYDRLKSYSLILLGILSASFIAAMALSRLLQRSVSQPILNLAETAQRVSTENNYSLRAQATGDRDEVSALVDAFNRMLDEIERRDAALQESERQFRTLANSIPQLAWMGEADGNLFWYNQRWYEYTGTTPEQMAGWGWKSVHDPEKLDEVIAKWQASLASGHEFEMIFPLRGADGEFRHFLTRAVPIHDARGNVVRWFGTNTDITEQRNSQEALRQTEKLAATGRLAASIAHEINNPLEAVTNLVYLARKQPANLAKYLQLADQELDRIAQITKNTLGFYRDSASPTEVNISQTLQEVLSLYTRKLNFKKIVVYPDFGSGFRVIGYPGEIRQIFANLISNAIEALQEGGEISIRASHVRAPENTARRGVRITFFDNGPGIPTTDRNKIFKAFYTTKKDVGTGLGLWLILGIVEKHRGTLKLRSSVRPGRTWTAFSVFLPDDASLH